LYPTSLRLEKYLNPDRTVTAVATIYTPDIQWIRDMYPPLGMENDNDYDQNLGDCFKELTFIGFG